MGRVTLAQFRSDLQNATGNRPFSNDRLDRAINYAYFEVEGAVDFEELNNEVLIPTVAGVHTYALPTGTGTPRILLHRAGNGLLTWVDKGEYYRLYSQVTPSDDPQYWTRVGDSLKVFPSPAEVGELLLVRRARVTPLINDADTTILPDTWDPAIFFLSVNFLLMSVGEDGRSVNWYNRGVSYIASRVIEEERVVRDSNLGATIAQARDASLAMRAQQNA